MPDFLVIWEIEIAADSPLEAAQQALKYQRDPNSSAVTFDVTDTKGKVHRIDLNDYDSAE